MTAIDRRKLMVGGAVGAAGMTIGTVGLPVVSEAEELAAPETVEAFADSFRRFLAIYNTMPPKVQKAFLVFLEWYASRQNHTDTRALA